MKQSPAVFSGILAVFGISFVTLAMVPAIQLGSLQPAVDEDAGDIYPIDVAGQQAQGRQVYVSQGCVACHTEQVRDASEGADLDRGWGVRRTVARDYIYEKPAPPRLHAERAGPREHRQPQGSGISRARRRSRQIQHRLALPAPLQPGRYLAGLHHAELSFPV